MLSSPKSILVSFFSSFQFGFKIVVWLAETVSKRTLSITKASIQEMNSLTTRIVHNKFARSVSVWNSHMALKGRYDQLCLRQRIKPESKRMWACRVQHYSLRSLCSDATKLSLNWLKGFFTGSNRTLNIQLRNCSNPNSTLGDPYNLGQHL